MLKRTVSLSTDNLPMLWLDPHLYEKVFFSYGHTLPATEGGIQWRGGGGGIIFLYGSRRRWSWAELDTSSLGGLDIFYVYIP